MDYDRSPLSRVHETQKAEQSPEVEEQETQTSKLINAGPEAHAAALSQPLSGVQRSQVVNGLQRKFGNSYVQRLIQRSSAKIGPEGGETDEDTTSQINSMRGSGSTLPDTIRSKAEAASGTDLSGIRVSVSREINDTLGARAATIGNDIFVRDNDILNNEQTMLHEVAHTMQPSSSVQTQGGMSVTAADHPNEAAADSFAAKAMSMTPVAAQAQREGAGVQREGEEDEMQMQREGEEDELQAQRQIDEDENAQLQRMTLQREGEEDEMQLQREEEDELQAQREGEEDEMQMQREGEEDEMQMQREEEDELQAQREGEEDELQAQRIQRHAAHEEVAI